MTRAMLTNLPPTRSAPATAWRFALLSATALLATACAFAGQSCTDCHSGKDPKAPVMAVAPGSAHAELECEECHSGVKQPCQKNMKVAQCKLCHSDQTSEFNASSHAGKIQTLLQKDGAASPTKACLSCHGGNVHKVLKSKDPNAASSRAHVSATCLSCHEKEPHIAVNQYMSSVHGRAMTNGKTKAAECADCHGSHKIDHSQRSGSRVARLNIPATCGTCHPKEKADFEASVHWQSVQKGFREPPVCTDCHGEHTIRSSQDAASATFVGNVTKTCGACHASEKLTTKFNLKSDSVQSFKDSFHGLSNAFGDTRAANCSSCHSHHIILPSSDSRSMVYPANLEKTCGHCHPGASARLAKAKIHTSTAAPAHWSITLVRVVYFWLILLTLGGMLFHNLLDLYYKSTKGHPYHRDSLLSPRFSVNERLQHAVLATSFILLAVSGFALKFADSPFAWPFHWFSGSAELRRSVHRGAALAFVLLGLYHALYLALSSRGRTQFKALFPRPRDVADVKNVMLKYLGLRPAPIEVAHYCYTEKAEYWALVWGSIVMTLTGLVLYFVNVSLSALPLWAVELSRTIHYLEALLAVLAIIVWHGYWVVFDPETYPLNLTWLIGRPRPAKAATAAGQPKTQLDEQLAEPS
jgi:cytochrome b subunit of formate dehydrogenase